MTVPADLAGLDQQIHAVAAHYAQLLERRRERRDAHEQRIYQSALNNAQTRLDKLRAQRDALA